MSVRIKSLAQLQFRQWRRSKSKGRLFGDIFGIIYLWVIEFVVFCVLKDEGISVPALVTCLVALSVTIPDFILKLIIEQDATVMDAFLKTRPIPQERWDRFLSVSQLWKESNLVMPLAMAPACFLFLPFRAGMIILVVLYLLSALGGFLVMLLKHRGTYQPEKMVKSSFSSSIKSATGNFISGIQFRSFLRSKRLRTMVIYLGVLIYLQCITQSLNETVGFGTLYVFLFVFLCSCTIPQYGFAVEANFFNGIWSRPIRIEKLLANKYWFGILCGAVGALLCLPLCIWSSTSVLDVVAITLFVCGFANLLMLVDSYNCVPFDLFGKAFFNNQGSQTAFKGSSFITVLVTMGIGWAVIRLLPGWKSQVILGAIGIAGFCLYRPYFRFVVSRFMKNRYKYMAKYTSK